MSDVVKKYKRLELIKRLHGQGLTWREIAKKVSKAEGQPVTINGVYAFARKNGVGRTTSKYASRYELVSELAEQGLTWREITEKVSEVEGRELTQSAVYTFARKMGITKERSSYQRSKRGKNQERDQEIFRLHTVEEKNFAEIAKMYGVSRQRIQQILKRLGYVEAVARKKTRMKRKQILDLADQGLTSTEISRETGVNIGTVYSVVPPPVRDRNRVGSRIAQHSEHLRRIQAGESIHSVAGGDRALEGRLRTLVNMLGIKSKGRSRWMDHSHRDKIIKQMVKKKATWREIADRINKEEMKMGYRPVNPHSIRNYAYKKNLF